MRLFGAMRPDSGGAAFTPTAGVANWILEAVASKLARIARVTFGGETTVSTAMRTRIARDTAVGTGARTAVASSKLGSSGQAASDVYLSSTYATTQPTIENGSLFGCAWNANGDVVTWVALDPEEELLLLGAESIECRADVGTGASTYGLTWREP